MLSAALSDKAVAKELRAAAAAERERQRQLGREWRAKERDYDARKRAERAAAREAERERKAAERAEAKLQREAHRADLRRQRAAEARERARQRKAAAKERERARRAKERERAKLKRTVGKAKSRARKASAPKARTPVDALVAIGTMLGATPTITTSPVSGRYVHWQEVARYQLGGLRYAELHPLLAAVATDPDVAAGMGSRRLTRMVLQYRGPRSQRDRRRDTREWTLGGGIGAWEVTSERAEGAVAQAAADYEDTTVAWLDIWVAAEEANDTGLL